MQGPAGLLNTVTYPPGALPNQARIVIDGVRGAIFVYKNGTPLGSLVGSWASTAGTDPYGNIYPQGFNGLLGVISGITFEGTDFFLNANGLFMYSGTPAANNLQMSVTLNSGTDQFGNVYLPGLTFYWQTSLPNTYEAFGMDINFSTQTVGNVAFYTSSNSEAGPWTSVWQMVFRGSNIEFGPSVIFDTGFTAGFAAMQTSGQLVFSTSVAATTVEQSIVAGDTHSRYQRLDTGHQYFGPGTTAADVELFRSAAGILAVTSIVGTVGGVGTAAETWHALTIPSGWTAHGATAAASFRYKLLAESNQLLLAVDLNTPSTAPGNGTIIGTLPTGYIPAVTTGHLVLSGIPNPTGGQTPHLDITTAGDITTQHISASDVITGYGMIALD